MRSDAEDDAANEPPDPTETPGHQNELVKRDEYHSTGGEAHETTGPIYVFRDTGTEVRRTEIRTVAEALSGQQASPAAS